VVIALMAKFETLRHHGYSRSPFAQPSKFSTSPISVELGDFLHAFRQCDRELLPSFISRSPPRRYATTSTPITYRSSTFTP
jgi:hypothetical protein